MINTSIDVSHKQTYIHAYTGSVMVPITWGPLRLIPIIAGHNANVYHYTSKHWPWGPPVMAQRPIRTSLPAAHQLLPLALCLIVIIMKVHLKNPDLKNSITHIGWGTPVISHPKLKSSLHVCRVHCNQLRLVVNNMLNRYCVRITTCTVLLSINHTLNTSCN